MLDVAEAIGSAGGGHNPIDEDAPRTGGPMDGGRALFESVGCAGCHADSPVAPPLGGLVGRVVRLTAGSATVDDDYLRESILEPAAHIVAGYALSIPSYRRYLSDEQVAALVAYVKVPPAPTDRRPKRPPRCWLPPRRPRVVPLRPTPSIQCAG